MGRIGGILFLKVDGVQRKCKGSFTYNLGVAKKTMIAGNDGVHGYTEVPQIPSIEGAITDTDTLDLKALCETADATVTLEIANGKVIMLSKAVYAADGNVTTDEGEIEVRFEGESCVEV